MNGIPSSFPSLSRVRRICSLLRTSTHCPTFSDFLDVIVSWDQNFSGSTLRLLSLLSLGAHSYTPAQITIEGTFADELLYMGNAHITRPFEFFEPQANPLNRFIQLDSPFSRGPLGFETRQYSGDLAEVDAIAALVWAAILCVFDFAVRNSLVNDARQIADLIVFLRAAHIERFAMDQIPGGVQYGNEGAADVFDMHNWPPGRAVAFDVDVPCGSGPSDKVVEHQIKS